MKKELYLVAFYVKRPRNQKMTHSKDYMSDPANFQYDERIEFARGLKSRDRSMSSIILNLNTKQVVKNTYDTDQRDFTALFKYFLEGYPKYVAQAMSELDLDYLKQFLPQEAAAVLAE